MPVPDDHLRDSLSSDPVGRRRPVEGIGIEHQHGGLAGCGGDLALIEPGDPIDDQAARFQHRLQDVRCIRNSIDNEDALWIRHVAILLCTVRPPSIDAGENIVNRQSCQKEMSGFSLQVFGQAEA